MSCNSDGTWLLIIEIVILKNESHHTTRRVNAHICEYCNLESPLHKLRFMNHNLKVPFEVILPIHIVVVFWVIGEGGSRFTLGPNIAKNTFYTKKVSNKSC